MFSLAAASQGETTDGTEPESIQPKGQRVNFK